MKTYFSQIEEKTPKCLTDVLTRHGYAPIKDTRVNFENSTLTITTKGGQEFLINTTLPILDLYPLEDGLILKCKFKSVNSQSFEVGNLTDFCYMTLTGHPLNDLHPLSIDQVLQITSKANIAWVGKSIPLVILNDVDSVKFCLVCRQNSDTDIFSQIKPESRNRNISMLSNYSDINLRTIHNVSFTHQSLSQVVVTQGLATDTICISLLTKSGRVYVYESDMSLNFQLMATYENIASIADMNFLSSPQSVKLVNEDLAFFLNNRWTQQLNSDDLIYFKGCMKNLKLDIVMLDTSSGSLLVFTGGKYIIHTARQSEVTNMSASPESIQIESKEMLQIRYEGGRLLTLQFGLRIACQYVSSITTTLRRLLPASEYVTYLSRLITLFKAERGSMFQIFAQNFVYLIGLGPKTQNIQEGSSKTTAFQKLIETQTRNQNQKPFEIGPLSETNLKKAGEIFKMLQLLLEELKLDRSEATNLQLFQNFVYQFGESIQKQIAYQRSPKLDLQLWCEKMDYFYPVLFEKTRIITRIYELLTNKLNKSYLALKCQNQQQVSQFMYGLNKVNATAYQKHPCQTKDDYLLKNQNQCHVYEKLMIILTQEQFGIEEISNLPYQIQLPIHEILTYTRSHIEEIKTFEWPNSFYVLIKREDILNNMQRQKQTKISDVVQQHQSTFALNKQLSFKAEAQNAKAQQSAENYVRNLIGFQQDSFQQGRGPRSAGLSATIKDSRFLEVEYLLSSDVKMKIKESSQAGELNEEQFLANQKLMLDKMFRRQLSKCIGRGAVQLGSKETLPTEKLEIPPITASATVLKQSVQNEDNIPAASPTTITVEIKSKEEKDMMQWPEFHNGVAAALRIERQSFGTNQVQTSRNWIIQHRQVVPKNDHGGFLLGLGLLGQLSSLQPTDIYQHLKTAHDSTTIGILLGRAASKLGQMGDSDSKMMCLHIPALLPHTLSVEYSLNVQSAAVIGAGLLYLQTGSRAISEMLLSQIAKKPNTDKLVEREGYSFSAGLALGLVNLAAGVSSDIKQSQLLVELELEERLVRFVQGGKALPLPRSMLSQIQLNENAKSSAVKETDQINTQITAPGALTAIALIYLKSNSIQIARRIEIPQNFAAMDNVTPQTLVLRVIARNLILWDGIQNTKEWISNQVPEFIRMVFESNNQAQLIKELKYRINEKEIDFASIAQSYVNIKAASILSIGFKFAGTSNKIARDTVLSEIAWLRKKVQSVVGVQPLGGPILTNTSFATKNQVDRNTVEKCLCMCALSLGMIMAGSCDVESFKILRVLRKRFESEMNFGHNQAINQALGMVFLGQGQYTLSRSNKAIAGLFCSVYPVFPISPSDNRFHLQALRHFYVFALETRLLQAKDIDSGEFVKIKVQVEMMREGKIVTETINTPEIVNGSIVSVAVKDDEMYHDISLQAEEHGMIVDQQNEGQNGEFQKSDLQQIIYVKRKNISTKLNRATPAIESLQSIMKDDLSHNLLQESIKISQERLNEVNDPLVKAFLKTFATRFDSTQALTTIMLQDKADLFQVIESVEEKVKSFQSQNIEQNLVQLYSAYQSDKVYSLAFLLNNIKSKLTSKTQTPEPVIEQISIQSDANKNLAISILNDLVKIGEKDVVASYINALLKNIKLTDFQQEVHNALLMCGVSDCEIQEIVSGFTF